MQAMINTANAQQTGCIEKILRQEIGINIINNMAQGRYSELFSQLSGLIFTSTQSEYIDTDVSSFWFDGDKFQAIYF